MLIQMLFTGSRVYGKPKKNSDVDMVILVSKAQLKMLRTLADHEEYPKAANADVPSDGEGEISSASLRFGKINLIVVTDPVAFACWQKGTDELKKKCKDGHPSSREQAKQHFRGLRSAHLGIKYFSK